MTNHANNDKAHNGVLQNNPGGLTTRDSSGTTSDWPNTLLKSDLLHSKSPHQALNQCKISAITVKCMVLVYFINSVILSIQILNNYGLIFTVFKLTRM